MKLMRLISELNNHEKCIEYLEKRRWPLGAECCYCGSQRKSKMQKERRYKCLSCNKSYSVLVGTLFEASKLPLHKWFLGICLIMDAKKGISSLQLSRHLEINKDSAWYLQKRIRESMRESSFLQGIVEVDETYVGGSLVKMSEQKKKGKEYYSGGMEHKQAVLGMFQREGKVVLRLLNKAWGKEIKPILEQSIDKKSTVITDGFGGYYGIGNYYQEHVKLNHEKKIFKVGKYNMSSIEGFWTMIKRAVIGTYHKISLKYLQDYLDEIAFKYNYRNHSCKFNTLINKLLKISLPLSG